MKRIVIAIVMVAFIFVSGISSAKTEVTGVVNINTATKQEILMLPGIGEVKADEILKLRAAKPFTSKEQLLAVRGIGDKMLQTLSPLVTLDGKTTITATQN